MDLPVLGVSGMVRSCRGGILCLPFCKALGKCVRDQGMYHRRVFQSQTQEGDLEKELLLSKSEWERKVLGLPHIFGLSSFLIKSLMSPYALACFPVCPQ